MSHSSFSSRTVNIKMVNFVWSCSLWLYVTKRKSNVIRHIGLVHGIDARTISENVTKKDVGMNASTEDFATMACKKFCCNRCSYITVKKYNIMRHLKSVHSQEGKPQQEEEEERHYTKEEFKEIMTRLRTSLRLPLRDRDPSKFDKDICVELRKSETKIREGCFKALEILSS